MNIEEFREYCLNKKAVEEDFPFDESTLVFKVQGKIFAITNLQGDFDVNLKCDPARAEELRESFGSIKPGWHMNKKHWNTVSFEAGELSNRELIELIDHSYEMVIRGLSKKLRKELEG